MQAMDLRMQETGISDDKEEDKDERCKEEGSGQDNEIIFGATESLRRCCK